MSPSPQPQRALIRLPTEITQVSDRVYEIAARRSDRVGIRYNQQNGFSGDLSLSPVAGLVGQDHPLAGRSSVRFDPEKQSWIYRVEMNEGFRGTLTLSVGDKCVRVGLGQQAVSRAPDRQAPDRQAPDRQAPDRQAPDRQTLVLPPTETPPRRAAAPAAQDHAASPLRMPPAAEVNLRSEDPGAGPQALRSLVSPESYQVFERASAAGFSVIRQKDGAFRIAHHGTELGDALRLGGSPGEQYERLAAQLSTHLAHPPVPILSAESGAAATPVDAVRSPKPRSFLARAAQDGYQVRLLGGVGEGDARVVNFQIVRLQHRGGAVQEVPIGEAIAVPRNTPDYLKVRDQRLADALERHLKHPPIAIASTVPGYHTLPVSHSEVPAQNQIYNVFRRANSRGLHVEMIDVKPAGREGQDIRFRLIYREQGREIQLGNDVVVTRSSSNDPSYLRRRNELLASRLSGHVAEINDGRPPWGSGLVGELQELDALFQRAVRGGALQTAVRMDADTPWPRTLADQHQELSRLIRVGAGTNVNTALMVQERAAGLRENLEQLLGWYGRQSPLVRTHRANQRPTPELSATLASSSVSLATLLRKELRMFDQ